jgi:hypothetical protein
MDQMVSAVFGLLLIAVMLATIAVLVRGGVWVWTAC